MGFPFLNESFRIREMGDLPSSGFTVYPTDENAFSYPSNHAERTKLMNNHLIVDFIRKILDARSE